VGKVVGTFAMSHVVFEHEKVAAQAERVFTGMREIAKRIKDLKPDVLIVATNDHLNNFNLALQVPFIVGVADSYTPLGDMGIPKKPFKGQRDFAEHLIRYAAEEGFDLGRAEEVKPDHGFAFPNLVVNPKGDIPVVPFYINVPNDIPPTPTRVWALGLMLKKFVETQRPAGEKVAVLGAGGLSHWLCEPEQGKVNEVFDRMVIDKLITGRGQELTKLTPAEIQREAGRSGLETMHWIFAAACLGGGQGEQIFYEPMPEWITGMGGIALRP